MTNQTDDFEVGDRVVTPSGTEATVVKVDRYRRGRPRRDGHLIVKVNPDNDAHPYGARAKDLTKLD